MHVCVPLAYKNIKEIFKEIQIISLPVLTYTNVLWQFFFPFPSLSSLAQALSIFPELLPSPSD